MTVHISVLNEENNIIDEYDGIRCTVGEFNDIIDYETFYSWYDRFLDKYYTLKTDEYGIPKYIEDEYKTLIEFCEKYITNKDVSFHLYDKV